MLLLEGTYAAFELTEKSNKELYQWIESNRIVSATPQNELHVTTTFSLKNVEIEPSKKQIRIPKETYSIAVYKDALVLEIQSEELQKIHKAARLAGATYSFPSYKPHITISYDAKANKDFLDNPNVPTFDIILSHEVVKPLDMSKVKVKEMMTTAAIATHERPMGNPIRRKLPDQTYKEIKKTKQKSFREIAEQYKIEYYHNNPIILENESTGEWMFLKYGTLTI
jgi:DNA/RNA endonuclease G (NUC1)